MSDVNRFKQVFVKYKVKPPPPKVNAKKRKWQQKQQKQQKQQLEKDGLSGTSPPKGRQPSASPPKRIVVEDDFSDVVDLVAYEKEADHGLKSGKNSLQNIQSIIPIDMPPELGILHQTDDSKKSGCRDTKKSTETSRAKPNKKRRAYRFAHVPGFVIITNALTLKEQLQWSYRCLTEYADAKHTNLTNIKGHNTDTFRLWHQACLSKIESERKHEERREKEERKKRKRKERECVGTRPSNSDRGNEGNTKDDIKCHVNAAGMREKAPSDTACGSVQATHTEPEPPSQQQQQNTSHHTQTVNHLHSAPARRSPRHPTSHKSTNMNAQSSRTNKSTSSEPNHFLKLKKLRWSSLGYHYDWTNRTYYPKEKSPFPRELADLSRSLARVPYQFPHGTSAGANAGVGGALQFNAEAALVNFYPPGSIMRGHLDDAELTQLKPIVSLSLGCRCIFMVGGPTKDKAPSAFFLNSGDVCVMSEYSRRCYHGVPRIMKDSFHCCLKGSYDLCKGDEDDDSEDHEDADNNEEDCAGGDHDGTGSMTDLTRNGGSAMRDASDDIDCKARKHNENSNGADRKGCSSDVDKNGDDSGIKNTALFDEMLAFVQDLRSVKEQNGHSRSGGDEKDVTSVGTDAASPGYSTRLEVELLLAYLSQNRININVRQVEDKMNYFTAEQKGEQ